ncbi:hypothetical protein BKI52_13380 [marine bacterium AO1-C]|nr:hypothetical protein BKI52_13380 [marine bacterium AO1-C]
MIRNYFKIALRNLLRQKFYSAINLLGLAVGIACAVLLYLYVQDEMSYDSHFKNADRIYRVEGTLSRQGESTPELYTQWLLADQLEKDYPEIQVATKTLVGQDLLLTHQKKKFYQDKMTYVDEGYFQVFSHRFIKGDPATAIQKPKSIVLTKGLATKVFGRLAEVLGETVKVEEETFTITGIIDDIPDNTHFQTSAFISMNSLSEARKERMNVYSWSSASFITYVKLKPNQSAPALEQKLTRLTDTYINPAGKAYGMTAKLELRPLLDIRLYAIYISDKVTGNSEYIYILLAITFLVLLIAIINYMNLATARSVNRAKEVGIRKVVGSYRSQLVVQFLTESFLLVLFACVIGLVLAEVALPFFNKVADKSLSLQGLATTQNIIYCSLMLLVVALLSGSYPAFVLSSFNPIMVLKGKFGRNNKGAFLRKGLVVVQFSISIMLIIGTWTVYRQLSYVMSKDVGYNRDQLLVLEINDKKVRRDIKVFKDRLRQNPDVLNASSASFVPVFAPHYAKNPYAFEHSEGHKKIGALYGPVDEDYIPTLGLKLLAGRNFTQATDKTQGVIINETVVKKMGWRLNTNDPKLNPIGKKVARRFSKSGNPNFQMKVIGVVKDFHAKSLHETIEPVVLRYGQASWFLVAKVRPKNMGKTMRFLQQEWQKIDPIHPFRTFFVNQEFARQYEDDQKRGTIFFAFSILAIFIACLGLFGLVSFVVRQRHKEIGIRKVLGASVQNILQLISMDFVKLVLLANLLAFPLAYYMVRQWLQNFAYQTSVSLLIFVLSGLIALVIALITISTQALRATRINPAEVLKDE